MGRGLVQGEGEGGQPVLGDGGEDAPETGTALDSGLDELGRIGSFSKRRRVCAEEVGRPCSRGRVRQTRSGLHGPPSQPIGPWASRWRTGGEPGERGAEEEAETAGP